MSETFLLGAMSFFLAFLVLASSFVAGFVQLPNVGLKFAREPNVAKQTALDRYAWEYDANAGYDVHDKVYQGPGFTAYVLDFKSQSWFPEISSRPVWQHWLTICIPHGKVQSTAFIYNDGPNNSKEPDADLYAPFYMMCSVMDGVVAYLQQTPNQPLSFADDPTGRGYTEDDLIAFGWRRFLNGSAVDPRWLMRLPMTKAGVNAMTAIQLYAQNFANVPPISDFIVCGASKRGWNTWTIAAVDSRVKAAIPIVMPIGNVVANIGAEYEAYGNFSFALQPYLDQQITSYLYSRPGVQDIANIVDPLVYIQRYTMPIWSITACGDEFTLPDSPRFWFNQLPGPKFLRIIPNAEHTLADVILNVVSDIAAFYYMQTRNVPLPEPTWTLEKSVYEGNITMVPSSISSSSVSLSKASMWFADTIPGNGRRDFRFIYCASVNCLEPVFWFARTLKPQSDGSYFAQRGKPVLGWSGFLIQLDYDIETDRNLTFSFRISSEVNIVPDEFPFSPCPAKICDNPPKVD